MKKVIISAVIAASLIFPVSQSLAADVNGLVAEKAAIIANLHKKARKALVRAAQDKSYTDFLASDETGRHEHKKQIDMVSLNVQENFHVEEMCLIDANGPELARIVGNKIADDLSADESGAVFFEPSFSLKPKSTYISPIYMSPDAHKWVLAYVTPIAVAGKNEAILHYEHGLDVYQNALNKEVKDLWVLAVSKDGYIVSDSRRAIPVSKAGDHEDEAHYFTQFAMGENDLSGVKTALDQNLPLVAEGVSYSGAYKQVEDWTIIALKQQ